MHITPLAYGLIGLICLGACAGFFVASLVQFFKARHKGLSSAELQKGFGHSGHGFILLGLFALFNSNKELNKAQWPLLYLAGPLCLV